MCFAYCFLNDVHDAFHAFHAFHAFYVYAYVGYRHEQQHISFPQQMAVPLSHPLTIS
jgi:hypothetical protein